MEERALVWADLSLRMATWVQFANPVAPGPRLAQVLRGQAPPKGRPARVGGVPSPRVGAETVPAAWLHDL